MTSFSSPIFLCLSLVLSPDRIATETYDPISALAKYGQRSEEKTASAHGYAMGHIKSILKFHSKVIVGYAKPCEPLFLADQGLPLFMPCAPCTSTKFGIIPQVRKLKSTDMHGHTNSSSIYNVAAASGCPNDAPSWVIRRAKFIFQRWVSVFLSKPPAGMLHLTFSSPKRDSYCISRRCLVHWPSMSYSILTLLIKDTRRNHQTKPNNQHSQHPHESPQDKSKTSQRRTLGKTQSKKRYE